jgi:hypothetical protein
METPDELDQRLSSLCGEGTALEVHTHTVQIAQAVALTRIAVALEKIEATGIYVYQQGTEPESDTVAASEGRRRG